MDNKIPDNVLNPSLYRKAKKIADQTYKRAGAYKNMFLVKKYKELGGKYSGKKTDKLATWRKEKWVSVKDYLNGKNIPCGEDKIGNNACRPTKRINSKTPITIQEVLKLHSREKVKEVINKKLKNMNLRINWKTLKIS